jgi:hypothetical protein
MVVADGDGQARDLMARGRQLRRDAGVSMGLMAAQCGVTVPTISKWETRGPGRVSARDGQARRWVAILAVLDQTDPGLPRSGQAGGHGSSPVSVAG